MALHERGAEDPAVSLSEMLRGKADRLSGESVLSASDYYTAITQSGFPGICTLPPQGAQRRLEAYLRRIVDKEMPDQGYAVRRPETLRRWLTAYAAASSQTASYSSILDSTTSGDGYQPAKTTTIAYRDQLTQLRLLDPVPAWSPALNSPFKWLQFAPKHQLADPGLAAHLLGLTAQDLGGSKGAAMAGHLFESLATLSVRVIAEAMDARVGHLRTKAGRQEVDLIVEAFDGSVVGVEVKLSAHVTDEHVKHLRWLREQMPDRVSDVMVLYSGKHAYRRSDGVAVVPLSLLGD